MKQFYIILFIFFSLQQGYTQNCNLGKRDGANSTFTNFQRNYLVGMKMTLSQQGTLTSINLFGKNTGANVRMAIYGDYNGVPKNLIVKSTSGVVGNGLITLNVTNTLLPAGDYWVMAVYDINGNHVDLANGANSMIHYQSLDYSNAMPSNINTSNYLGLPPIYSLNIDCGNSLSTNDLNVNDKISLFPNPSTDFISVSNLKTTQSYTIINQNGQIVQKGIANKEKKIDIKMLLKGLYYIKFENGNIIRFIKK